MNSKKVIVVGGGIAGLEAASLLSEKNHEVTIIEKETKTGGNAASWYKLFPDKRKASEVFDYLEEKIKKQKVKIVTGEKVDDIVKQDAGFKVVTSNNEFAADSVLLATGFKLFDSERKEEFGYGIYDNVITSVDLEKMFKSGNKILTKQGNSPKRIAMIHCVGSRDEKSGNRHCSKVCCITAVKQAMELREFVPDAEIFCFYIDLRMFGAGYEELYREAQEKYAIQFIRGRLSEAAENMNGSLQIKAEDTLSGRPLKMKIDLMVLMPGMEASEGTRILSSKLKIQNRMGAFIKPLDSHFNTNKTEIDGVFIAGTCTGPMTITETFNDARSAAIMIDNYLK